MEVLSDAQRLILSKIVTSKDTSTFVLCINEEQEAQLENWKLIKRNIKEKKIDPQKEEEELKKVRNLVYNIYKTSTYCPYCGQLAKVDNPSEDNYIFSCDCEGSKNEKIEKEGILNSKKELDEKFYNVQIKATNLAMKLYKEHYKDIVEFRKNAFEKLDNDIMNAPDL